MSSGVVSLLLLGLGCVEGDGTPPGRTWRSGRGVAASLPHGGRKTGYGGPSGRLGQGLAVPGGRLRLPVCAHGLYGEVLLGVPGFKVLLHGGRPLEGRLAPLAGLHRQQHHFVLLAGSLRPVLAHHQDLFLSRRSGILAAGTCLEGPALELLEELAGFV